MPNIRLTITPGFTNLSPKGADLIHQLAGAIEIQLKRGDDTKPALATAERVFLCPRI